MKDLIKTLLSTTSDRIKNPFLGTFIISWIVFNWKPIIYLLFEKNTVLNKINFIDSNFTSITNQLWYPLFLSLFYSVGFPYLMWLFERLSNKAIEGRRSNDSKLRLYDLKSEIEVAKEEIELENTRSDYREKADLNRKIKSLEGQLENSKALAIQLEEKLSSIKIVQENENEQSGLELIKLENDYEKFKKSDLYDFFKEIGTSISQFGRFPNDMNHLVNEKYRLLDLVHDIHNTENDSSYTDFTEKGKFFWKSFLNGIKFSRKPLTPPKTEEDDLPF